ncbi:hypothetical protein E2C01_005322 [Portunus trituberculatus]|uniref:Uncharacterized protein n=1 Tax=Portunus trituberculatus TaxID=210409 RepID=A0A5B7CT21_PORTR|nr:hypothetical protein [Portunus trituberculatus]
MVVQCVHRSLSPHNVSYINTHTTYLSTPLHSPPGTQKGREVCVARGRGVVGRGGDGGGTKSRGSEGSQSSSWHTKLSHGHTAVVAAAVATTATTVTATAPPLITASGIFRVTIPSVCVAVTLSLFRVLHEAPVACGCCFPAHLVNETKH